MDRLSNMQSFPRCKDFVNQISRSEIEMGRKCRGWEEWSKKDYVMFGEWHSNKIPTIQHFDLVAVRSKSCNWQSKTSLVFLYNCRDSSKATLIVPKATGDARVMFSDHVPVFWSRVFHMGRSSYTKHKYFFSALYILTQYTYCIMWWCILSCNCVYWKELID